MGIRVLAVDDQEIVRLGLKAMFSGTEFEIVCECDNGEDAITLATTEKIDVVLLDVRMSDGDGLNALGRIKLNHPDLPVIIFSAYDNPTYVARAVALNAAGYLMKGTPREELLESLRLVVAGVNIWTRKGLRRLTGALATPRLAGDREVPLTQRESDVLKLMTAGATNKVIAKELQISYETVKDHVQHILVKIGVTDRTQAAIWAVRQGLV